VGMVLSSSTIGTILFYRAERLSTYLVPRKSKKEVVVTSVGRG
jgi:hypothetical protein